MKIFDVISAIEEVAPPAAQAEWDKSGIQVAADRLLAEKLAVCLDPLPEIIARALDWGAEFILSHHPLALKPELPARPNAYYRVLKQLFAADVWLYAAHTSLDANIAGPAGWLGRALGLKNMRILEESAVPDAQHPEGLGFGAYGDLPLPLGLDECAGKILRLLSCHSASVCGGNPSDIVERVAFCGGSGASLAMAADRALADLYITGDVKYHAALEAPLPILDVGHFSIENEMMRRMADLMREKLDGVEVLFVEGKDPFRPISY